MAEKTQKLAEIGYALLIQLAVVVSVVLAVPKANVRHFDAFPPLLADFMRAAPPEENAGSLEIKALQALVSEEPVVSMILDKTFGDNIENEKLFHEIRNVMVPTVVNPNPVEKVAVVFCTSQEVADKRLEELGYRWAIPGQNPGRGIAIRK